MLSELDAGIFHEEIGGRTVGRGQGHVDFQITVIIEVYAVDQA